MSARTARPASSLLALDAGLLLLGMIVLLMVLRLLRFDDPNPILNAWTYLLGVPTALIGISMMTRVLTNDSVEKSIQIGFLVSVATHLILICCAMNVLILRAYWPDVVPQSPSASTPTPVRAAQFFEPKSVTREMRPDYLKPVETQQNAANPELDPVQRDMESAKLNIDVAKDELKPNVVDKPFEKPRKEAAPSQPTISSTAEKLDRPDLSKPVEKLQNSIEVPSVDSIQPLPSQQLQAAAADAGRTQATNESRSALSAALDTKLNIQSQPNRGTAQGLPNRPQNIAATNQELEKAINKTASDLPERPSPLKRGTPEVANADKPMASNVPVPNLGTPSSAPSTDRLQERDTRMQSRSRDAQVGTRPSLDTGTQPTLPAIQPSLSGASPTSRKLKDSQGVKSELPSDSAFFADPRFAMNDKPGGQRPARELGDASLPAGNAQVPIEQLAPSSGSGDSASMQSEPGQDLARELSDRSSLGRSEIGMGKSNKRGDKGLSDSSLSPVVGNPLPEAAREAWAGISLDAPRKGLDPVKRDVSLPEIRDTDFTVDRFKRPDIGGPKIANSAVPIPAPAFSQRLNRNNEKQGDATSEMGPLGPQTEEAIERGLQFLARYQRPDGSWHLEDFGERVDIRSDTAATALALLSFQGAGYTHRQFKYEQVCNNALSWMVKNQRPNGDLYVPTDAKSDSNAWLYSHAIATLALCEAFGMTKDEAIQQHAQKAIDFLIQSQDPQGGGWRYQPKIGSDTSVTGWCMMALKSAELAGLNVSTNSYRGITKWLEGSQASEREKFLYRYNWQAADTPATRHGRVPTPVMTSVGLLMRLYLGWKRDNADMMKGTEWLLRRPPAEGTVQNPQRDTYYWYYATQVLFHMGGERWKAWYGSLYPMLIRTQRLEGDFAGSWDPNGPIPDAWGRFGGRLYVTTLNLLSLEVYYRHLPIYDATAD